MPQEESDLSMKTGQHPKSLARLITNLSNDPDIQLAGELKAVRESLATEDPSIEPLKQRVLQAARTALANIEAKQGLQAIQSEEAGPRMHEPETRHQPQNHP